MNKFIRIFVLIISLLYSSISFALEYVSHIPQNPQSAIIILHGWQQSGNKMSWMTSQFQTNLPNMAFYYPTGPERSPNGGYQWFEIPTIGAEMAHPHMYNRMIKSAINNVGELHSLIENISKELTLSYDKIYIAGFSQGGLMAILTALTSPNKIGKAISFSGVPLISSPYLDINKLNKDVKIQIIQGDVDRVIPHDSYALTNNYLRLLGFNPDVKLIKNLPHRINDSAINYAIEFLK